MIRRFTHSDGDEEQLSVVAMAGSETKSETSRRQHRSLDASSRCAKGVNTGRFVAFGLDAHLVFTALALMCTSALSR